MASSEKTLKRQLELSDNWLVMARRAQGRARAFGSAGAVQEAAARVRRIQNERLLLENQLDAERSRGR